MHRTLTALMALFSLLVANLYPAGAQRPTPAPSAAGMVGQAQPANPSLSEQALHVVNSPFLPAGVGSERPVVELAADQTIPYLVVRDKTLLLSGHVTEDVLAINCRVVIKPGASVGNMLTAVGGEVVDNNQGRVRFVQQSAALLPELAPNLPTLAASPAPQSHPHPASNNVPHGNPKPTWTGGQFALLLLGGLAGLLALVVSPRAMERTGENMALEPGRCLVVGTLGVGAMLIALAFSYGLMRSPFGPVWTPLAAAFAGLCLAAITFGWICGMRYAGQRLATRGGRFGRTGALGMFLQIGIGLGAFFLANVVMGKLNQGLGVIGLLLEFALALMGLGAALLSGFGTDPNWLTARMRGEVRWLARTPRL